MDTAERRVFFLILILLLTTGADAEFYRWVDDEGTIHYSDSLPPTESQKKQVLLNDYGRVVKNIPAPKTIGELKKEERLTKLEEQERIKREKAERRDRVLMAIYLSVEDIEHVRDERIATIKSAIQIAQRRKDKFTKKLEELDVMEQESMVEDDDTPAWIVKSRKHYQEQLYNVVETLAVKEREKLKIKKRFASDINRYLELKEPTLVTE